MKDPHVARNLREIPYRKLHNQGDFVSLHICVETVACIVPHVG